MAAQTVEVGGRTYHLFQRTYGKGRRWWFWYWEDGKRVRKPTGCTVKRDAIEYIKRLAGGISGASDTLRAFAKDFFTTPEKCPYLAYKKLRRGVSEATRREHRKNLEKYLLPRLGDYRLSELTAPIIESLVHHMTYVQNGEAREMSAPSKDSIWRTLKVILEEAHRRQLIMTIPMVRLLRYKGSTKRRDILSRAEVRALFPDSLTELERIWKKTWTQPNGAAAGHRKGKPFEDTLGLVFGLLFRTQLHAGLRPGEVRAIHREQLFLDHGVIYVDRQFNSAGQLADPKMSREEERDRWALIPQSTADMLKWYLEAADPGDGPIFTMHGRIIRGDHLADRFRVGLENAGILKRGDEGELYDPRGRTLSPYSLRYTHRSLSEGWLDAAQIQAAMGHRGDEISRHYLHLTEDQLDALRHQRPLVEHVWGQE